MTRITRSAWLADPIGTTKDHATVHIVDDETGRCSHDDQ